MQRCIKLHDSDARPSIFKGTDAAPISREAARSKSFALEA
jgi:hypothetical protein